MSNGKYIASPPDLADGASSKPLLDIKGRTVVSVAGGTITGTPQPVVVGNPTSVARGSQAATSSAVALGGSTAYTGGIDIWNSDTSNYVTIGTGTPTDGAGSNKVVLGPGQGYHEPTGDLSALKIIAATGTPVVNWIGSTR